MKPSCLGALALFTGAATAGIYPPDAVDDLSAKGMENLKKYVANNPIPGNCTLENAVHRKEWCALSFSKYLGPVTNLVTRGDLSIDQRKDYVRAVLCLQALPAKTTAWAPGAKSRFDDFIVVHVQMTRQVHASVRAPRRRGSCPDVTPAVLIMLTSDTDLLLRVASLLHHQVRASTPGRVRVQRLSTG